MGFEKQISGLALFFEIYSFLHVFCLFKKIKIAKEIYFLHADVHWKHAIGRSRQIDTLLQIFKITPLFELKKSLIFHLLLFVNPKIKIIVLSYEDFAELFYKLNEDSLRVVDELEEEFIFSVPYKILYGVIQDSNIIKYYQSFMTRVVSRWYLFSEISLKLIQDNREIILVPDSTHAKSLVGKKFKELDPFIPKSILRINYLLMFFRISKASFFLLLTPLVTMFIFLKNGYGIRKKQSYDLAMPVLWGVFKNKNAQISEGIKRFHDDLYLYSSTLRVGQIIHIFGDWKFSKEQEKEYKEAMNEKGIPFVEKKKFRINNNIVKEYLKIQWIVFKGLFSISSLDRMNLSLIYATQKALYNYFNKYVEIENVDYKVEYVKTDYNPAHIVNSILCNQKNRKTVGMAHAATPYDAPQIAYAHFDRYFVLCEAYVKRFGHYWENNRLVRTGRESIDWLWESVENKKNIFDKVIKLYGRRKFIVTITLPSKNAAVLDSQIKKLYNGLCLLSELTIDCHIFLRIRDKALLDTYPILRDFKNLSSQDPRMIFDHENFTTHDLIAISDLVIATNASWAINEGLVANSKVFTFGTTKKEKLYFSEYGEDFILTKAEDIYRVFFELKNGFKGIDCNWEKLKKDADYNHDGMNCMKIRMELIKMINSIQRSKGKTCE